MIKRSRAIYSLLLFSSLGLAPPLHAAHHAAATVTEAEEQAAKLVYRGTAAFDPATGGIDADLTIEVLDPGLEQITLLLNAMVGEAEVTGAGVASISTELDEMFGGFVRSYTIDLAPVIDSAPRTIRFQYAGRPIPEDEAFRINSISTEHVELTVDSFWFPFDKSFTSPLDVELDILVPGEWTGIAPGTISPTDNGLKLVQDFGSLDISFALLTDPIISQDGPYAVYDARSTPGAGMDKVVDGLQQCTAFLNDLAGPGDELPAAQVFINDRDSSGYSRRTMIALTDISETPPEATTQFVCHELAHNWSLADASGPENWHNEGLADAIANLALREVHGIEAYANRLDRYRDFLGRAEGDLGPIWTPALTQRPEYSISYRAAPLAFAALEEKLGSLHFRIFVRRLMNEKVSTTPRMLSVLEEVAGAGWRSWFESLLAREAKLLAEGA